MLHIRLFKSFLFLSLFLFYSNGDMYMAGTMLNTIFSAMFYSKVSSAQLIRKAAGTRLLLTFDI